MIDYKALGKRIRNVRLNKNYTQSYIAEKLNLSSNYISDVERGVGVPSLQTIVDISNILETSVDKLMSDNIIDSKIIYNKEIKELVDDFNHDELKTIIEIIKFSKYTIRKISETERNKHEKK